MKSVQKKLKEILSLPWENEYKITRIPEEEGGGYSVCIPLLGANLCVGDGDTIPEAIENLQIILEDVIEEYLKEGRSVPVPRNEESYSGTMLIRTTQSLHARLAREASNQGVSLNYLVGVLLERSLAGFLVESVITGEKPEGMEDRRISTSLENRKRRKIS